MPTAAKLIGAFCIAIVAWLASEAIRDVFPENTNFGIFNYVNVVIGFLCGWMILGARAGRGFASGISNGLTAVVMLVFWGLFIQGAYEMFGRSMKHRYGSPWEAVGAIFDLSIEFGQKMLDGPIIITLITGAVLAGIVTEIAGQRWK
ncbi:TrgA family protein [Sagittula sp. S175]|uniref:TrgA family protein n=1 Tax=Sagittula sp. S175 TaxID=3415129 RepID=UPI003C7AE26E